MLRSETRFATTSDGTRIAYQVFGAGPGTLVFAPAWVSHVELNWSDPAYAAFLRALSDGMQVVLFDKRGTGMSDRVDSVPDLETRMEDLRAVMDACEIERAVLLGASSGAAMAALFAATYCRRVRGLVLHAPKARARWAPDYPWGMSPEELEREISLIRTGWDSGEFAASYVLPLMMPSRTGDQAFAQLLADYYGASCSREDAIALTEMWWETDYRPILPAICLPTLVIGHEAAPAESMYVADRVPGAEVAWVGGGDSLTWGADTTSIAELVGEFVTRLADEEAMFDRVLATVLFTDVVDSTARATELGDRRWGAIRDEHDSVVRSHLERFGGQEVKTMGDGFLATFEGPGRAIRCGVEMARAMKRLGIEIRVGVHTGEIELADGDVSGITVAIAARVMGEAGPSEVLVSQTVRDLVAGSGLLLQDAGERELKGVPDRWRLYRATP